LNKGKLKQKYIDILTTQESINIYSAAFTSELIDEQENYQVYEQLGDLIGNQFIVWYIYRRFPQLKCMDGVKVAARLRINYGSKQSFYKFAEELGFWPFISATNDLRYRKKKDLLEDVFEAFLGATALILDEKIKIGVGNAAIYQLLKIIFNEIDISLRYEDLYDPKTRLKELFDIYEDKLGPLLYETSRNEKIATAKVFRVEGGNYFVQHNGKINKKRIVGGKKILIGTGTAALEADAQQFAAKQGLETMKLQGFFKIPPKCYRQFMNPEDIKEQQITKHYILQKYNSDINALVKTKDKSKYQCKYQSTVLAMFCRKRNIDAIKLCLEMKADTNITDTDGLYPLDLLFIGPKDPELVQQITQILLDYGLKPTLTNMVFHNYYSKYNTDYFKNLIPQINITSY
jgi:dsRNA-specific ribonuclease